MKKFLSAMLVVLMIGTLTLTAFADTRESQVDVNAPLSPSKVIQPYGTTPPSSVIGPADIHNPNEIPPSGGQTANKQTVKFYVHNENGEVVNEIEVEYLTINQLPADHPARAIVQAAMENGLVNGEAVAATLFVLSDDKPLESFFASSYGGTTFTFTMEFSALNDQAINPCFWFYNSDTNKWDKGEGTWIGDRTYEVSTSHSCPMIVTVDGYESYYSRFVGKKVASPDTLAVLPSATICTVISVFGAAGVSKKHI